MVDRIDYIKKMRELFYMRRRTYILLKIINNSSFEDSLKIEERKIEIRNQLELGEELLKILSEYWIRSNEKGCTEAELKEDYDNFTNNYLRTFLTLDDAVTDAEDIVFAPDRIEGLTKKQVELLKKSYSDRIRYINRLKKKVDNLITKKSLEGDMIKYIINDFLDYEDEFDNSLKEYNRQYVEREKYNDMFLKMDSNLTKLIKRLKKEDKKNTLK